MRNKEKIIISAFGGGGHEAQMNRLMLNIGPKLNEKVVILSDVEKKYPWSEKTFILNEVRSKYRRDYFSAVKRVIGNLKLFITINNTFDIRSMITTGPGIGFILAVYLKFFKPSCTIIHVETWSRFYSKSLTGKLMYKLADKFYVQNKELLLLYPNAIYSGRL